MDTLNDNSLFNIASAQCQSCLNTIGFPDNWEHFRRMVEWRLLEYRTYLYCLNTDLFFERPNGYSGVPKPVTEGFIAEWTAPRWFVKGDISFFYYSKSALDNAKKVYAQIKTELDTEDFFASQNLDSFKSLKHQALIAYGAIAKRGLEFSRRYAGKIFAIGIAGDGRRTNNRQSRQYWHNPNYCSFRTIRVMENPIDYDDVKHFIRIQQRTITPLTKSTYTRLSTMVVESNSDFADTLDRDHREIDVLEISKNGGWRAIVRAGRIPFLFEEQVREYLLDGFLSEMTAKVGEIAVEVESLHSRHGSGIMDYVISIGDVHVPVEAKRQAIFDDTLFAQLNKYCNAEILFGEQTQMSSNYCLIADSESLWVYRPEPITGGKSVQRIANFCDLANQRDNHLDSLMKEIVHGQI